MHLDQKNVEPVIGEMTEVLDADQAGMRVPAVRIRTPHASSLAYPRRATNRIRERGLSRKNRHRQ